jgi:hypothetical protein
MTPTPTSPSAMSSLPTRGREGACCDAQTPGPAAEDLAVSRPAEEAVAQILELVERGVADAKLALLATA